VELFWKNYKNCIQKWNLQVIFSKRCLDCPQNKIVHNFPLTCSNEMNQSFPHRQKYNLWEKKNLKFLFCPISLILSSFGHNFYSQAPIRKKIIYPWSYSVFLFSTKVSKNHNKNSNYRYLPKIQFIHRTDNGPLGVKAQ